jgi:hypothetical protein
MLTKLEKEAQTAIAFYLRDYDMRIDSCKQSQQQFMLNNPALYQKAVTQLHQRYFRSAQQMYIGNSKLAHKSNQQQEHSQKVIVKRRIVGEKKELYKEKIIDDVDEVEDNFYTDL